MPEQDAIPASGSFLGDIAAGADVAETLLGGSTAGDATRAAAAAAIGSSSGIVLTGMGSSLAAAQAVLPRLHHAGRAAVAIDAGELLHEGLPGAAAGRPVLLVSQSGRSAEIVGLLERLPAVGAGPLVAVTNDPASPLAARADVVLAMRAGDEQAVATRTFVASLVVLHRLVDALLAPGAARGPSRDAPETTVRPMRAVLAEPGRADAWAATFDDVRSIALVARGALLGIAAYGALTTKEAAHVHAEAIPGGAFRHGPLEMAGPALGAVVLAGDGETRPFELQMAADIASAGSPAWLIDVGGSSGGRLPDSAVARRLDLGPLPDLAGQLAATAALQLFVAALARHRGLEPGVLLRGGKVTEIE